MITLAITAYNEKKRSLGEWALRAVSAALDHPLVSDIVIVNDASDDIDFLRGVFSGVPNVRIVQNEINLGVFGNKVQSVKEAREPWVVMCDSDNFMGPDYFDRLAELLDWDTNSLHCPALGRPMLDYREHCGVYNMEGFVNLAGKKNFGCLFNTGNQFVHRQSFINVFGGFRQDRFDLDQPDYFAADNRQDPIWRVIYDAADSAFINTTWLKRGGTLDIVKGLHYVHNCMPESFARAPKLKESLHPIYLCEMMDVVSCGKARSYRFLRRDHRRNKTRHIYEVDGSSLLGIQGCDYEHIEPIR